MAIAGLQNVPALDPSVLRQSRSPSISQHGIQGATSSSPSSILKMWKELEDEWLTSRVNVRVGGGSVQHESNDGESSSASTSRSPRVQDDEIGRDLMGSNETETVDSRVDDEIHARSEVEREEEDQNSTSEQSQGFGESERERVRQIFREWMNTGANGSTSNGPNTSVSPRAQLLGQPELERVRIVREWIQMTSQGRENTGIIGEDQEDVVGSQIERVRDGLVLDHSHAQDANSRRDIRKLCGRQALIDLLEINKQERLKELQVISERGPVRNFANRNRIQSVFRIRLLHYGRSVGNSRASSTAVTELGFLRRQTVTELREGFLSRLDSNAHAANLSSGTSNNTDGLRQNEARTDDDNYPVQSTSSGQDVNIPGSSEPLDGDVESQKELVPEVSSSNGEGEQDLLEDVHEAFHVENLPPSEHSSIHTVSHPSSDADSSELATIESAADCYAENSEPMYSRESSVTVTGASLRLIESYESLHVQDRHHGHEEHNLGEQLTQSHDVEDHQSEDLDFHDSTVQAEAQERQVGQNDETQPRNRSDRVTEQIDQLGDSSADELHSTIENEGGEQSHFTESVSDESRSEVETSESWLPETSVAGATSTERADVEQHFSDDISAHGMELRELVSRRRVSSLLSSGFRESLDHLIQSYVERQTHHTTDDWEVHVETLHPPFAIHDPVTGMDNGDHDHEDDDDDISSELDDNPDLFQSIPMPPPLPSWGQDFDDSHWSRDFRRSPGTDVEMINDLRIEMARIHQRLNNMQRTLEACMDMQFELQRSVRQEVSAALNRSVRSSEAVEKVVAKAGSKWDSVRRGICCVCTESNIDSLLYRCGHMCTCTKCANLLVEGKGKCPMCRAPVVEVIRAYTIQ